MRQTFAPALLLLLSACGGGAEKTEAPAEPGGQAQSHGHVVAHEPTDLRFEVEIDAVDFRTPPRKPPRIAAEGETAPQQPGAPGEGVFGVRRAPRRVGPQHLGGALSRRAQVWSPPAVMAYTRNGAARYAVLPNAAAGNGSSRNGT